MSFPWSVDAQANKTACLVFRQPCHRCAAVPHFNPRVHHLQDRLCSVVRRWSGNASATSARWHCLRVPARLSVGLCRGDSDSQDSAHADRNTVQGRLQSIEPISIQARRTVVSCCTMTTFNSKLTTCVPRSRLLRLLKQPELGKVLRLSCWSCLAAQQNMPRPIIRRLRHC